MALSNEREVSDVDSVFTNVTSQFRQLHSRIRKSYRGQLIARSVSVSQERRCKRGGGYRIQAK